MCLSCLLHVLDQLVDEIDGARQRDQVTARYLDGITTQALSCHAALEAQGEEPIPSASKDMRGHLRPALNAAWLAEHDIGFGSLVRRAGGGDLGGHIVQEVGLRVELDGVPRRLGRFRAGLRCCGAVPPLAGRLTGQMGSWH